MGTNEKILRKLRAEKKRLQLLALRKRKIILKKQEAKAEERQLKAEIARLKKKTSNQFLAKAKRFATSPETKSKLKRFGAAFQKFANDYGWDDKDLKKKKNKLS